MSRVNKYRAWNIEKKIMCYDNEDGNRSCWDGVFCSDVGMVNNRLNSEFSGYEYMQYIGIEDKNGKEIYEKDVVLIDGEDEYFVVEWDSNTARFVMNSETLTVDFDNYWGYQVEVIGNIHENADLLKEAGNE